MSKSAKQEPEKEPEKNREVNGKITKNEIFKLAELIDKSKCKLFKWYDIFSGSGFWFLLLALAIAYIALVFVKFTESVTNVEYLTAGFALVAIIAAVFSLMAQFSEKIIVERNFKKMMKLCCNEGRKLEEKEKPFLKALIKMKFENTEFELRKIYELNEDMFTPEKLLEKLYGK
jgi:hypothetical protein